MIKPHHLAAALVATFMATGSLTAHAKLPAPSPEAKAKADEAKAKAAHGDKVGAYKLCLSMDRTAAHYYKTSGKDAKSATATPPCADPGPFAYSPDAAAAPVGASPAVAAAAKPTTAPPLEAAGAHSPAKTATAPPSGKATAAEQTGTPKK